MTLTRSIHQYLAALSYTQPTDDSENYCREASYSLVAALPNASGTVDYKVLIYQHSV